ncbi:hypothetical protein KBB89_04020, partial [Candidatus Gracilibacteria bacterium]|nr:hypothetical protein [Candidatus Gracilibacteria bacterium]
MFIILLVFFGFGYGTGWISRQIIKKYHTSKYTCNIDKKGVSGRSILAIILVIIGFYFEIPLVVFFAGFTWYESRAKWCIV